MDPTVEEAIQRLKEGNASPEDAHIAFDAGYKGGPNTQAYYKELGLLDPPQDVAKPNLFDQNAGSVDFNKWQGNNFTPTMTADGKFVANPSMTGETPEVNPMDLKNPTVNQELASKFTGRKIPNFSKFKDTEAFDRGMQAWSPLAPALIKGGDRSGEASGYRAGAAIQDKAAADYSKIVQWNKQRATDNALADKVAAAQASGQWRQNANALGAEGGASVVASQNQAVTPDIMAQKQYQTQQMQNAERNMSEANARKIAAQNNRTKADMVDYNTQYNESRDAYAHNLATANNQTETKETAKPETAKPETAKPETAKPETTEPTEKPDGKVEDNTQNEEPKAAAETNQQSQAMENATQEVSEQQELQDLADEINGIHNAVESMKHDSQTNAESLRKQKARYDEIKPRYDELASKSKNPPPQASTPDFGMFDEELSKVPDTILTGVTQKFLN